VAHPKHEQVRRRYNYRCGYCGVSEADTGGELTVDHYVPVSAGRDDSDDNLVYACFRCNMHKGDFLPDNTDLAAGHRLLHPLLEDLTVHFEEDRFGQLIPLTITGHFHIEVLNLNRLPLIRHRQQIRATALEQERTRQLLAYVDLLQAAIAELEDLVKKMRAEQDPPHNESV
jgi:HNH endonuclease